MGRFAPSGSPGSDVDVARASPAARAGRGTETLQSGTGALQPVHRPQGASRSRSTRRLGYPVAMGFSEADLELIDRTEEIRIETSIDGADVHRTIIWAVVDDGDVFVRSVRRRVRPLVARGDREPGRDDRRRRPVPAGPGHARRRRRVHRPHLTRAHAQVPGRSGDAAHEPARGARSHPSTRPALT